MAPEVLRLGAGESRTPPRIKLVGIGGAGCNIVSDSGMEAVAVLKAEEGVHEVKVPKKCVLTPDHVKLFKTTSPQMFHAIGGNLKTGVFGCIGDADIMFLFTGLGGETGSSRDPCPGQHLPQALQAGRGLGGAALLRGGRESASTSPPPPWTR